MEAAIGLDRKGRHYFVSVDGRRYRPVPHFPATAEDGATMFGRAHEPEQSKLQLLAEYRGEIAFVAVLGGVVP
jgi:hypothetical protein